MSTTLKGMLKEKVNSCGLLGFFEGDLLSPVYIIMNLLIYRFLYHNKFMDLNFISLGFLQSFLLSIFKTFHWVDIRYWNSPKIFWPNLRNILLLHHYLIWENMSYYSCIFPIPDLEPVISPRTFDLFYWKIVS